MSSASVVQQESEVTARSPSTIRNGSESVEQSLADIQRREEKDPLYLDLLRATHKPYRAPIKIPKKGITDPQYRSRPKLHLDWIISTDPSNPLPVNVETPQPEETEEIPESDWVIDTREALYNELKGSDLPPSGPSRPEAEDLEWIITTRPDEPIVTRIAEPVPDDKDALASEWIINTNPADFPITEEDEYTEQEDANNEDGLQTADYQCSESTAFPDIPEIDERLQTAVHFNEDSSAFEEIEVDSA
ncbi:hypothetical protein OESDEN_03248 [Oesophagostomum dentatum]|uniref:Uncharacterized protein n=1 Tax=Oesophagostomum dentatum TaxID=61180 RepID=A0A0B1TL10_OESDE|nr:hypothetical protein OESDEN_03248 [Oesophagostomum dentatum]